MNNATIRVDADALRAFVSSILQKANVPAADAEIVADCLLTANLSGVDSHGVVRLAHYVRRLENGTIRAQPQIEVQRTAPAVAIVDGGDGLGHVVTHRACTEGMTLARETGTAMVSVRHSSHFGMTGFYLLRLVAEGFIGMMMTATDAFLIPFGARKPFLGTNPIAFGFPTPGIPLVLDMATTSIPYGKVALAKTEGREIPPDWGLDEDGNPTTDPNRIAGLHPIAGPKGSGLAMVIDLLCSVLSGMPFGPHINQMYGEMDQPRQLGHFICIWDVRRLMPLERFVERMHDVVDEFHALPPAEGFSQVYYPGEIEGLRREERRRQGVPLDPGLRDELTELGHRFGIGFPA